MPEPSLSEALKNPDTREWIRFGLTVLFVAARTLNNEGASNSSKLVQTAKDRADLLLKEFD